jgi:hypothetical protein
MVWVTGALQFNWERSKLPASVVEKPSDQVLEMSIVRTPEAVAGNSWVTVADEAGCPGDAGTLKEVLLRVARPPVTDVTEPVTDALKSF